MTDYSRRKTIGGLAAAAVAALSVGALTGGTASAEGMASADGTPGGNRGVTGAVRRYVVGSDPTGQSYTQFSGYVSASAAPVPGGILSGALWATHQMPVDNSGSADEGASGSGSPVGPASPGHDGTSFGFIYYPAGQPGTKPIIHRTATTDYWVILEGEATLVTDKDEINLRAGDTVVVRGAHHGWSYPPERPFLAISVSLDAIASSP